MQHAMTTLPLAYTQAPSAPTPETPAPLLIGVGDTLPSVAQAGGKAATLARLAAEGLPVPGWCVITPAAFAASLAPAAQAQLAAATTAQAAARALDGLALAPQVELALQAALRDLVPDGAALAVRSSAVEEDSAGHSFAGQLESFLNVAVVDVARRVVDVWRSGFAPRVYAYRAERALAGLPAAPAVLIQRMVPAAAAGVAFSADAVSGRRGVAVVAAVAGLGDALVGGEQSGDSWHVDRTGAIIAATLHDSARPVLRAEQVQAVAALTRRCAALQGRPQDIEWAWANDQLYLLQARPITTLADLPDPDGVQTVWDNSNIIESYGGMTTPLTYSFARRAYEEVYQELCRILGVPRAAIQAHQPVFANMIGLIRGRIYYNLLNWYRVLALLPGFKANRRFMEQMMGVKEPLPDSVAAGLAQTTWQQRLADRLYLARTVLGLAAAYTRLDATKRRFYARLDAALGQGRPDLSGQRADELVAYYHALDSQLLHHWDAPLLNDFFAMIFYGVLRKLTGQWCGDVEGTLQNDLLTGEGGMISAEPAARVRALAELAVRAEAVQPGLVALLETGSRRRIEAALAGQPQLAAAYQDYLSRFGERCLNELKLESATLHDDPLPLLRAVGRLARQQIIDPAALPAAGGQAQLRGQAEQRVAAAFAGKPLRRTLFGWVLRNARRFVRDRENLRFERTRVFGRARQIFRELGQRFYAADLLDHPADVFYLEVDEICGVVEGTATSTDLRGLAAVRRAEFTRYATLPTPDARFTTLGMVHQGNRFQAATPVVPAGAEIDGEWRAGLGCSPGRVQGRARVVRNPLDAELAAGDIVVAEHTDPSWIMILPLAAGLVVERGSLLSHAAIVARELGIPAVVGLTGAAGWIADGSWVAVDGSTGVVRKMSRP
jgi:pyruvate,water dikinase